MRMLLVWIGLYIPFLLKAQEEGIHWIDCLSWSEVVKKATAENKFIFVDAYATWCGPCRTMDNDVYPNENVGRALNGKFISVRVQMDKTSYDNDTVKKWYRDARIIASNYAITSFPTFLFFYPDGKPMHKAVGYRSAEELVGLVEDALNPEKQYYALLENYQPGKFDTSELKGLARALRQAGGDLAARMAVEYLSRIPKSELGVPDNITLMMEFSQSKSMTEYVLKYLSSVPKRELSAEWNLKLISSFKSNSGVKQQVLLDFLGAIHEKDLIEYLKLLSVFKGDSDALKIAQRFINRVQLKSVFNKDILLFISNFITASKDRGFTIFYKYQDRVDKVMESKSFAINTLMNVIIVEEYDRLFKESIKNGTDVVPWQAIGKKVKLKFGETFAKLIEIQVKSALYKHFATTQNKYWSEYIKYYIDKIEKIGYDTTGPMIKMLDVMTINNFVFDAIFYHSNDTGQINTGLKWMEGVIRRNPRHANNIDTYANLLYKAGRVKEAIQWQEKAVQIDIEEKSGYLAELQLNLNRMKKGEPTWLR